MADELLKVIAFNGQVRGVVAETKSVVERLRQVHDTGPTVTAALGRVATGALLLAAMLEKVTEREPVLTVRVAGDGPAGAVLATASPHGWVRGFAENPRLGAPTREDGKLDVGSVVGSSGTFEVTRDPGYGIPYRGVVPLRTGEIGEDLAYYLKESEQTPSAVGLGVFLVPEGKVTHAGGFIMQLMPGVDDEDAAELEQRVLDFGAVTTRFREGATPKDIATEIFPRGCQIVERTHVRFRCGCSMQRVERALKLLGTSEVRSVLAQSLQEPVFLTCEFCHKSYPAKPALLQRLLAELRREGRTGESG
ncbi:MAG: Hsp33 family molecular chaperone HslO [Acidobacteriota bacterium]|nr:MAG: Hsp33 family molecular chaperone HslO [Acidobacteriota bacterium]